MIQSFVFVGLFLSLVPSFSAFARPPLGFGQSDAGLPYSAETRNQISRYMEREKLEIGGWSQIEVRDLMTLRNAKGEVISTGELAEAGKPWGTLDPQLDGVEGTSTELAHRVYPVDFSRAPVLVAVIDGGVDINHEDLRGQIWTNEKEVDSKIGEDRDGNGFAGDIHGWNFLGGKDGRNIDATNLEVTREYARMKKLKDAGALPPSDLANFQKVEAKYIAASGVSRSRFERATRMASFLAAALDILHAAGLKEDTEAAINALPSTDPLVLSAKEVALGFIKVGRSAAKIKEAVDHYKMELEYYYNLDFNSSSVVGDHADQLDEIGYGNADVIGPDAHHGTHCAGIIAALRNNSIGMNGQAANVKILPVRAIPNGDERDKDVANAVIYAVNQGARVISMSFGKDLSPNKAYVDAAYRYAEQKGVLVVHAAGNDSKNNDETPSFPNRNMLTGAPISNWIEVGASSAIRGKELVADFSNYGVRSVDLFAPGKDIYSTIPGNHYASFSGTSMATPEVAGVAALLLSHRPEMQPAQIRELLMSTVRRYPGLQVIRPGANESEGLIPFEQLSITGGVVDAFAALQALLK